MYRYAAFVYIVCFTFYIWFSREPDYFESETTRGQVVDSKLLADSILHKNNLHKDDRPVVQYRVGQQTYYCNGSKNLLLLLFSPQGQTTVIYNAGEPEISSIYRFFGYWLTAGEILFSIGGYIILFLIAAGIGGNKNDDADDSLEVERQMKYN